MRSQSAQHRAHDSSGKTARIITICILCVGILLLLLAIQTAVRLVQLHVFGHETRGRVVRQDIRTEKITRRVNRRDVGVEIEAYYAIVSFTTDEGTFTISSYQGGDGEPIYPTDSSVTVVYRPGHPEEGRIQQEISGFSGLFGPLLLVVFGTVFTGMGVVLMYIQGMWPPAFLARKQES